MAYSASWAAVSLQRPTGRSRHRLSPGRCVGRRQSGLGLPIGAIAGGRPPAGRVGAPSGRHPGGQEEGGGRPPADRLRPAEPVQGTRLGRRSLLRRSVPLRQQRSGQGHHGIDSLPPEQQPGPGVAWGKARTSWTKSERMRSRLGWFRAELAFHGKQIQDGRGTSAGQSRHQLRLLAIQSRTELHPRQGRPWRSCRSRAIRVAETVGRGRGSCTENSDRGTLLSGLEKGPSPQPSPKRREQNTNPIRSRSRMSRKHDCEQEQNDGKPHGEPRGTVAQHIVNKAVLPRGIRAPKCSSSPLWRAANFPVTRTTLAHGSPT